ncbi:MAG TPA: uridine kinase [Candidatus Faecalibacterium faecipullorum]|uniref:Uridine kinase n=1 Tax=Candidatus Faecalibacterium faecipullorum TaxID=2838578 RepID=A0A9D2S8B5_9FIRM|nr:uridine kinase [Candidatus Faecalibacterium faecipullorum]
MNTLIIGIAGGSGSGKTTLALRLKASFGEEEVRLIPHDSYYKRHDDLPYEKRCLLNYDHPDAFDNGLLIQHLHELKAGRGVDCPVYDYAIHNRSDQVRHIDPAPVLIVEGILPFTEPALLAMFDYKIFVDTDADERILRRILRDVKERGRSLDSVITQYRTTVKPMHEAFVEPSKRSADIIIPNGGENGPALEMLVHHIRSLIQQAQIL